MARNSVTIKIGGDDSEFKKVLKGIGKTASAITARPSIKQTEVTKWIWKNCTAKTKGF